MRACTDCKYYWYGSHQILYSGYHTCYRKGELRRFSMITGESSDLVSLSATIQRYNPFACGKKARYFEPKEGM